MTTHAGGPIDLESAVRRLLRADVAVAAAWPSEAGVRITPKMRSLVKVIRSGERLRDDAAEFRSRRSILAAAKFAVRHPRIVAETLRHPQAESTHSGAVASTTGSQGPSTDSLEAALDTAREIVIDAQTIAAVERGIDTTLFGGSSRDGDEFVRIILRGSYHDLRMPQSGGTEHVVFEPRLLLHRSGVVQLTVALPVHRELTTTQLIEISRSDRAVLVRSEIPEPLLAGLPNKHLFGQWQAERDAGARVRVMDFPDPPTMADSLDQHLGAIGAVIGARLPREWNTHATVIAAVGSCCRTGTKWRTRHEDAIARVATRFTSRAEVDLDRLSGVNLSVSADHRIYTNLGSTTRIQVAGQPPEPIHHLDTVLIVEHTLLQYFRLRNLESVAIAGPLYDMELETAYAEAINVFSDMRQHEIRYGSAREIATRLLTDLGGEEMRRTIEAALNLSSQANATRTATIQSARSLRLTWAATILAALVGVPVLGDLLDYVSMVDASTPIGLVLSPLRWAAGTGDWGPWVVLATLAAAFFALWLVGRAAKLPEAMRRTDRFRRRRSWLPADLELIVESGGSESNQSRSPARPD
ncbi:hypothetical protein J7E25_05865 [Agromyces sp. ISL-38]|uniref:hypothetical protein n=1 Tax=Agromyces sp. ISL-38 TaxID=2819107 RepID=UPI001BE81358|nr:hypothetical protein [Agromyces sp. ISL-38]MBT2498615.1 hypothetical protein [Agromyces sp. ISL-38]